MDIIEIAYERGFNKALEIMDKIPPPKWIPVNNELPFSGEEVLVTDSMGEIDICLFNRDVNGTATWEDLMGIVLSTDDIKAWQILPEPYKDE